MPSEKILLQHRNNRQFAVALPWHPKPLDVVPPQESPLRYIMKVLYDSISHVTGRVIHSAWKRLMRCRRETHFLPLYHSRGKPFDYQEAILKKFTDAGSNGLICVPCGKGKTFMALSLAARLGKRFLVVVDKEFLLNQWKGEMEAFFPGLRIGILQGPKAEVEAEDYDCTICMIQSLVQKTYPEGTFRSYGFAIFDECHHLGASNFSQALLKIQTKYMLGSLGNTDA
jgi:superfamily II DNA or RNA helicase